jgi:cobalt-zinc-cadmium efflux system membrane fusion protein
MRPVLALALLAALSGACGDPSTGAPETGPSPASAPAVAPAAVQIVAPQYRVRTTGIQTTGKIQFNEERLVRITAPVTGRVVEVLARPGETVEPGRRLLVLDSPDLGQAKADYAKGAADAERSSQALALARELFEVKAIAQKEVRDAENDSHKAVAERERAAARLRTLGVTEARLPEIAARADASTLLAVAAPRAGVIVERNVAPGQVVAYGQSDTPLNLFVIADLSTMWVLADVYEPDVPRVHLGQRVSVTLTCCPDERYEGTVANIADSIDKDSRTLKVRAVVPNRGRALKAEMFVRVAIESGSTRVLTLPQTAVQRRDGTVFVLVETGPGQYQSRPIKPGAEFDGVVEVQEGVTPADRVVATGGILLKQSAQ